jgi:hypothetical protein
MTAEEASDDILSFFVIDAIEYYFGDPKPTEAPIAAYARALGYPDEGYVVRALNTKASGGHDPEFDERHASAVNRLFAKFGDDSKDGDEFVDAIRRMLEGMPASYEERRQKRLREKLAYLRATDRREWNRMRKWLGEDCADT